MSATPDGGGAGWLGLAATPSFALMAVLSMAHAGGPADLLCSAARGLSPLSGMVPMYLLMSLFHCPPWVRLVSSRLHRRREGAQAA